MNTRMLATCILCLGVIAGLTPYAKIGAEESAVGSTVLPVELEKLGELYDGSPVTGQETARLLQIVMDYGDAITSGDVNVIQAISTESWFSGLGVADCPELFSTPVPAETRTEFELTAMRVTSNDD